MRSYGDAVAHSLGLKDVPILRASAPRHSTVGISKLSVGPEQFGMTPQIPPEDTFIVAMYLSELPHHELWVRGRPAIAQGYARNSMRIVNLVEGYSAYITCPHETLVFYLPRTVLDEFTDEASMRRVSHLECQPGVVDPTIVHLGAVLVPAFAQAAQTNTLFTDHVTCAILTHLCRSYGGGNATFSHPKGGMTRLQLNRAKEFLASHCATPISLVEVARECGLSRGHFSKAFRVSAGVSPYQWLQRYRVDKAKDLLRNSNISIAAAAMECGFADQAHLTRVFSRVVGDSPAAWRRRRRG